MPNPLKKFLDEALPESFEMEDGEVITDVVVLVRVQAIDDANDGVGERYTYTTNVGLPFAAAYGMVMCLQQQLISFYQDVINEQE